MDLQRFKDAQNDPFNGFDTALREIRAGAKRGHWVWYVLPQLRGLGQSSMALHYGIDGESEAVAYLRDEQLRDRLAVIIAALVSHRHHATLTRVMGSRLDAMKAMSSMTLFAAVARTLHAAGECAACGQIAESAEEILSWGEAEGLARCAFTLSRVSG